jgi:hypothetical protein
MGSENYRRLTNYGGDYYKDGGTVKRGAIGLARDATPP